MAKEKAIIQIPESGAQIGPTDFEENTKRRFDKLDNLLLAIVASVVVSVVAVIISVIGIFLDQMRYNNAAYTDYSLRLEERNQILKDYRNLLDINNKLLNKISSQSGNTE